MCRPEFFGQGPPDLDEVREALGCIVGDADRAGDIVDRIRGLIKKAPPRKECLDINAGIREVIELTRSESIKSGISMQADLVDGLPLVEGDRVQLQQVILNLIVNAVEAMSGASDGTRELLVSSRKADHGGVLVEVRDSGPGLAPETSSTFSTPSTPRSLAVWEWACRSAVRLSMRTAADCGRARTCPTAPAFNSPCRRLQTLRRDAALVRVMSGPLDQPENATPLTAEEREGLIRPGGHLWVQETLSKIPKTSPHYAVIANRSHPTVPTAAVEKSSRVDLLYL